MARTATPEIDGEPNGTGREVRGVGLLYKAFKLIDAIADATEPPRPQDLLRSTGLSRGTMYRLLQALVDARYLAFDTDEGGYRLGTRVFDLAHRVWTSFDLRSSAMPELNRLNQVTGETVRLAVLSGQKVLYVDQREARGELRVASGIGNRVPHHLSASGKAMVAYLEPAERDQLLFGSPLEAFTPNSICDGQALDDELDLVKARGYATCVEERTVGLISVAAPILNSRRQPIGAIGVVAPAHTLDETRRIALGHDLIEAARRIAGNAGDAPQTIEPAPRPKAVASPDLRCLVPSTAYLGEGPLWLADRQRLVWVDMLAPSLLETDVTSGATRTRDLNKLVSAVAQTSTGLVLLAQDQILKIEDHDAPTSVLLDLSVENTGYRFNDAKVDRQGRLWVGSMMLDPAHGRGRIDRIDPDGTVTVVERGLTVPNGLGWSPDDRTFYFVDSPTGCIYACDFDAVSGDIENRRVLAEIPSDVGRPDGLTVDREGGIWVAHWDGWRVVRYTPDGDIDRTIFLPVPRPTSCAFGGSNMKTLFITSARIRLSADQLKAAPLSGSLFAMSVPNSGLEQRPFQV